MTIPTVTLDLSPLIKPQPRTVGDVPVGEWYVVDGIQFLRTDGRSDGSIAVVDRQGGLWWVSPMRPIDDYLGNKGDGAKQGEEIVPLYAQAGDVVQTPDGRVLICRKSADNQTLWMTPGFVFAHVESVTVRRIGRIEVKGVGNE